jgi:hypothetical protein
MIHLVTQSLLLVYIYGTYFITIKWVRFSARTDVLVHVRAKIKYRCESSTRDDKLCKRV